MYLFIDEGFFGDNFNHMGIAIVFKEGCYCFEYAAGGSATGSSSSGFTSGQTKKVTVI